MGLRHASPFCGRRVRGREAGCDKTSTSTSPHKGTWHKHDGDRAKHTTVMSPNNPGQTHGMATENIEVDHRGQLPFVEEVSEYCRGLHYITRKLITTSIQLWFELMKQCETWSFFFPCTCPIYLFQQGHIDIVDPGVRPTAASHERGENRVFVRKKKKCKAVTPPFPHARCTTTALQTGARRAAGWIL